jgi:hypothetical protein
MHTKQKIIFLLLAILFAQPQHSHSQYRRKGDFNILEGMSITPKAGYNTFFGDLVDESRGSLSIGVLADREINGLFSARAQLIGGRMQGTQIVPNTGLAYAYFNNFYTEFSIGGSYKPLNQMLGYFKQRTFQPYAHLNAGFVFFSATEYWGEGGSGPTDEEWRSASEVAPVISIGGGASIWMTPSISLNMEFSGAMPFTDKMDAHDVWYSGYDWMTETDPHTTKANDFYYTITVGVSLILQNSKINNDPRYNRKSYIKTRNYYKSKARRSPSRHKKNKRR